MFPLAIVSACSPGELSDHQPNQPGTAGSGGVAGTAGTAGTADSGGVAGTAATAGSAGSGGVAGTAGTAGSGGAAGTAGAAGSAGSGGAAGAAGSGGSGDIGEPFASCEGLPDTCGPGGDEDCCATLVVPGGTFNRDNDVRYPAEVSGFRLDRFEVTVGRFRKFVSAVVGDDGTPTDNWAPPAGAGLHAHLNEGAGLQGETGWMSGWDAGLPETFDLWKWKLQCRSTVNTWTMHPGPNERRPVNCTTWVHAYAFCIWDGGFLPTEAEWNYVAAAGDEQRAYPWGNDALTVDKASYGCLFHDTSDCTDEDLPDVGSASPAGDGVWGHADLAGSVAEWALDWYVFEYGQTTQCTDCVAATPVERRIGRGGSWSGDASYLLTSARLELDQDLDVTFVGFRCARPPQDP